MEEYKGFLIEECQGYYRIWLDTEVLRICNTEAEARGLIDNHLI